MTEAQWLECDHPAPMLDFLCGAEWLDPPDPGPTLDFLREKVTDRKLRLFAVACCRRVERLAPGPQHREAIEVVERFADGKATALEVEQSCRRCGHPELASSEYPWVEAGEEVASRAALRASLEAELQVGEAAYARSRSIWRSKRWRTHREATCTERGFQIRILHDVFGSPFRPAPAPHPAWLAWNCGTVSRLARMAYEERRPPECMLDPARLAVLADALEDAGCTSATLGRLPGRRWWWGSRGKPSCTDGDLLGHLRGAGPHDRGCWAVDLILGKE
jgi:hypothetical protein